MKEYKYIEVQKSMLSWELQKQKQENYEAAYIFESPNNSWIKIILKRISK